MSEILIFMLPRQPGPTSGEADPQKAIISPLLGSTTYNVAEIG